MNIDRRTAVFVFFEVELHLLFAPISSKREACEGLISGIR